MPAAAVVTAALTWLTVMNGMLAVFNMLPGAPLDGGRVLRAALWRHYGDRRRAEVAAARAGQFVGAGIIGLGAAERLLMAPITEAFVANIHTFIAARGLDLLSFGKGEDKDAIAHKYLAAFPGKEGVLFVGRAQEKAWAFRTQKRRNPATGKEYLWLTRATLQVNYFYFYCLDADFGPFFIKFCSYFPYNAK